MTTSSIKSTRTNGWAIGVDLYQRHNIHAAKYYKFTSV